MPRRGDFSDRDQRQAIRAASQTIAWFLTLSRRAQLVVIAIVVVAAIAFALLAPRLSTTLQRPSVPTSASATPVLGLPSATSVDPSNPNDFHLVKPYFDLSYNDSTGTPNWVSWRVTAADLGNAARKQIFDADATLPRGFNVIEHGDYSNSGFDRGHLCPHSDRAADEGRSFSTFVMTNIIPQAPRVNERTWAFSEDYLRGLVRDGNRLYVFAGPSGRGGTGSKGFVETIARGRVVVPAACWKIAVVVPERGQSDASESLTGRERVIGIWMPNDNAIGERWGDYRVSVATIEQRTGLRFFSKLPPGVADALRTKVDAVAVP